MSWAELDRVSVIHSIIGRRRDQHRRRGNYIRSPAGKTLNPRLSRLWCGWTCIQAAWAPGNAIGDELRQQALAIIKTHYGDFGPTFAHEKLTELHECHFSVETLRKWMIKDGLWLGKQRKRVAIHQSRSRLGELVQIDGSPHDWFEGRAPNCTLIVFIDDATSRLYVQDVRADNCSCVICTSAFHGGRMPVLHRYMDVA